ncbi:WD40 repeat domain-containing protein [Aliagarivorans marinus]|uniref:WD40 repeat domain-containing protein n=1 Tax=Aliagarivorans marinus TaxID=561965 RepID=UPI00068557DC|nr:hypothetical protein [Aliagarivorans marinus]
MRLLSRFLLISCSFFLISACTGEQKPLVQWQPAKDGAYAADISDNGKLALISDISRGLSLWDLEQQAPIHRWDLGDEFDDQVFITKFAEGHDFAIAASRDAFGIWDVNSGDPIGYWLISDSSIRDVALSKGARYVLLGMGDGKVIHLDLRTGRRLEFQGHSERINAVAMSANGRFALTGGNDHQALLWDTQSAQIIQRFPHQGRISMVALAPEGNLAFTADSGDQAKLWRIPSGEQHSKLKFTARQNIFSHVRFVNDGQWLLTGSAARKLSLWHVDSGQPLQHWKVKPSQNAGPQSAVVYSANLLDKQGVVSASSSGFVEVWPIEQ